MTNIYNITYYPNSDSVYILFEGCNFQCKGCYMKTTKWDYHLPDEKKICLQQQDQRKLSLTDFEKIAQFVAEINPTIPYRLDGFLPFNDVPWRSPYPAEVSRAAHVAQRHLWMVNHLHCEAGDNGQRIVNVYPPIK